MNKMTIIMEACWSEEEHRMMLIREAEQYNVNAEFTDGGDKFSFWMLSGTKDDLVFFLDKTVHWPMWRDEDDNCFEDDNDRMALLN